MRKQERSENGPDEPRWPEDASESPPRGQAWIPVVVLMVISGALYAAIPAVLFLPLMTAQKIGHAAGLGIAGEAVFWGAAFLLGREVVRRYHRLFEPRRWFGERPG